MMIEEHISITEVKRLDAERTPGIWRSGIPMEENGYMIAYVGNDCEHLTGKGYNFGVRANDAPFIAAAPRIAALAIRQAEELERLKAARYLVNEELAFFHYDDQGNETTLAIMNDTFGYACADADVIPEDMIVDLANQCRNFHNQKYKWIPLALWSQKECRSGFPFIEPIQKEIDNVMAEKDNDTARK